jgi:hypothetical protein
LQVVAVSVFLALAFAFYVFFAPFVGRKVFQDVAMGLYTPLVRASFLFLLWFHAELSERLVFCFSGPFDPPSRCCLPDGPSSGCWKVPN